MDQVDQPPQNGKGKDNQHADLMGSNKSAPNKVNKAKQKKKLLSYQNKPSRCGQLWDLLTMHKRNLCGSSCGAIVFMVAVPILCCATFANIVAVTQTDYYPEFNLEKLKHPLYSTAYYQPEDDEFYADFETSQEQQLDFESFFTFADYTNTFRKIGKDDDGNSIKQRSYIPSLDTFGPGSWLPQQCYSSVDYKYDSPVIGFIKNDSQLQDDLLQQVKSLFYDQTSITGFMDALEEFLAKMSATDEADEEEKDVVEEQEPVEEAPEEVDENAFVLPERLVDAAGGGPDSPHVPDPAVMGKFTYQEFETVDTLFEYVQKEGYGWDPEIPSVCFAFQVKENKEHNKYELEWLYRDQWPNMYTTQIRIDNEVAPVDNAQQLMGYARGAYNGINIMQVFAANSIMQRHLQPDAQVMMFTVPYLIPTTITSPILVMVKAYLNIYMMFVMGPLTFYVVYAIGMEKETGMRDLLRQNGVSSFMHFLSWLLHYTVLNFFVTLLYVLLLKLIVFNEDSFVLIFFIVFMAIQSLFGLIWALQPFYNTARTGVFTFGLFFWISLFATNLVNQPSPSISMEMKQLTAMAPLAAVKLTMDCLGAFHFMEYGMNFDNWDMIKSDWSLKAGVGSFFVNFFFWTVIGLFFDYLFSGTNFIWKKFHNRKVKFERSDEGVMIVEGLKERVGDNQPSYDLVVEKGKVCCLIGNNSAQKTKILEMIEGKRSCQSGGLITIKDSDFFERGSRPSMSDFLVYRSSEVILDQEMNAIDHLNLFAHIRGNQKQRNTRILCDKLLPESLKVGSYSESQRQCLQTLIALASDNSKILLLDEPTRGLGPEQRSELIKTLWRFKKDRYVIVVSSDSDLVNMLADSVAKVLQYGIQIVTQQEIDHKLACYKLTVEVEGVKPSDNLVKYLSNDVEGGITLEYHTDLLTYYILPNIPKSLLHRKSRFMEKNKSILGLVNFEFVSLTDFEIAQRNIIDLKNFDRPGVDSFEESVEEFDYEGDDVGSEYLYPIEPLDNTHQKLPLNSVEMSVINAKAGAASISSQLMIQNEQELITGREDNDDSEMLNQLNATPDDRLSQVEVIAEVDPEMQEFLSLIKKPVKRPNYKRELFYNFKKFRSKRKFCGIQCCCIYAHHCKENWNSKLRCCALFLLPALAIYINWHFIRYYWAKDVESRVYAPDWFPLKTPILVNEKTIVGDQDTKKWIEKMPNYEESFNPTYISTVNDTDFRNFNQEVYDYCVNNASNFPWSYGSYQFYEMNEEKNQYKILSYVNATSSFSTLLYPQFILESILKNAFDDDDFEFKLRATPFPAPHENTAKGQYLKSTDLADIAKAVTMSDVVGTWANFSMQACGIVCFSWLILNAVVFLSVMRDRTSSRKHYQEHHGQSKCAYWLARFFHDIVFYIPLTYVAGLMLEKFDPTMEQANQSIMMAPLMMLPFIYVMTHCFTRELTGILFLFMYQIFIQFIMPYIIVAFRLNWKTEVSGDNLYQMSKAVPMLAPMSSMINNHVMLKTVAKFRENNGQGLGLPIETDELHPMNAPLDQKWMMIQIIFFWAVLILLIEYRLHFMGCDPRRMKVLSQHDNDQFFGKSPDDLVDIDDEIPNESDSSEVAQIIGEGENIQLRFNVKQKPRQELALKVSDLRVAQRVGTCCWIRCRKLKPKNIIVNDLSMQVQAGSKFAIVSDSSQGKSHIIDTLISKRSTLKVSAILSKQLGRGTPVYTSQRSDQVLFLENTLKQNLYYFIMLGSVHPRMVKQMLTSFGLHDRQNVLVKDLNETERHITQLILALAGSNRTVILDEPFSGLTSEQNLKLVKIIRQKHDCTVIVTAKSKVQIELLQPHQIVQLSRTQEQYKQLAPGIGYLLALRLKFDLANSDKIGNDEADLLTQIVSQNYSMFEKLRNKKRSLVISVIIKLMRKAKISPLVADAIAEMVHEDLELDMTSDEMVIKCQLIRQLYAVVEALCKQFGECHVEQKQDEYAVLRVIHNDACRQKESGARETNLISGVGADSESQLTFSQVVDFINTNDSVKTSALSCHFLSARHNLTQGRTKTGLKPVVKIFRFSETLQKIERTNPAEGQTNSQVSQPNSQVSQLSQPRSLN